MTGNQTPDPARPAVRISPVAQIRQQWEYHQEYGCATARLTALGRDGWHLVGPPVPTATIFGSTGKLLYVFERPVRSAGQ